MSAVDYVKSLLDPFDGTFSQPKLHDGSVTRSSGLKFRATGNLTLDATGADNYIALFPGFSNGMSWKIGGNGNLNVQATTFPTHLGTTTDRANLRKVRLVSTGLKLSLLNSSDDNEGYWEAIRIPIENLTLLDTTAPNGEDYRCYPSVTQTNFSNFPTFQTGRLRDIHRFLFKLNSVAPDHPFKDVLPAATAPTVTDVYDPYFDMIIIRLVGRIDAVTPTMLQYDMISNQEVVYKDDTVMARLATMNVMLPDLPVLLDRTRFILPSVQIA